MRALAKRFRRNCLQKQGTFFFSQHNSPRLHIGECDGLLRGFSRAAVSERRSGLFLPSSFPSFYSYLCSVRKKGREYVHIDRTEREEPFRSVPVSGATVSTLCWAQLATLNEKPFYAERQKRNHGVFFSLVNIRNIRTQTPRSTTYACPGYYGVHAPANYTALCRLELSFRVQPEP